MSTRPARPARHALLAAIPASFVVIALTLAVFAALSWMLLAPGTLHTLARSARVGWLPERWDATVAGTWTWSRDSSWLVPCAGGGSAGLAIRPGERWQLVDAFLHHPGGARLAERAWVPPADGDTVLFVGMRADVSPLMRVATGDCPSRLVLTDGIQAAWPDTGAASCAEAARLGYRFAEW